jgi:hypothetical protein
MSPLTIIIFILAKLPIRIFSGHHWIRGGFARDFLGLSFAVTGKK